MLQIFLYDLYDKGFRLCIVNSTSQNSLHLIQVPGPDYRGAQHHDPAQLWSRQTSMDTSYNVPSIRTDMGDNMASLGQRNYGRFDSIAEVTESSQGGWRNNGYNL